MREQALLVVALAANGCGLDTEGLALLESDDGAADDASPGESGANADSRGEAGGIEDCTNGVDDDGDGKTDCEDPQCAAQGFACVPAVDPARWTLVVYAQPDAGPACAPDAGVLVVDPTGSAATCGCSCDVQPPSCDATLAESWGGGSCSGSSYTGNWPANTCVGPLAPWTPPGNMMVTMSGAPSGGACKPHPTGSVSPVQAGTAVVCGLVAGGGCDGGACVRVIAPSRTCAVGSPDAGCPSDYAEAHVVGDSVNDTRGCTPCACGPGTRSCSNPRLTWYSDSSCQTSVGSVAVDGQCDPTGSSGSRTYSAYSATPGIACQVQSASQPIGGVAAADARALCCR